MKALRKALFLSLVSLDIGDDVAFLYLRTLLGVDFHELTAEVSFHLNELAPRSHDPAESISFLVFLTNVRLHGRSGLSVALEFPEDLTAYWCHDGISLCMLEGKGLLGTYLGTELCVLGFLQVGQEVLLGLSALVVAVLLGVHG